MLEFWELNKDWLIAFFTGGGLLTVITAKATKKQAEAQAMKSVQEVYQGMINDLRMDKEEMRKDNAELRVMVDDLQAKFKVISEDVKKLKKDRCTVTGCLDRKRD